MRIATAEDVVALELLAVELEIARAVSVAAPSVTARDRDQSVVLPERAVVGDRPLVVDDAPCPSPGEPWLLGLTLGARRQPKLDVSLQGDPHSQTYAIDVLHAMSVQ